MLQCSRFHDLDSFDAGMRSCRSQLAMHATRRRLRRSMLAGDGDYKREVAAAAALAMEATAAGAPAGEGFRV